MPAVLFGSISTVADTSELQRQAFNDAFAAHGLDWHWDREPYRQMLTGTGGAQRIAAYAREQGAVVDAQAVHRTKSERFRELLAEADLPSRPGVAETIRAARDAGFFVGLVSTTSPENVDAVLAALTDVDPSGLAVVIDMSMVDAPKPDGEAYRVALDRLGQAPSECIAIEDNLCGVAAARDAGLVCVAFPNANTSGHDFGDDVVVVDALDPEQLFAPLRLAGARA